MDLIEYLKDDNCPVKHKNIAEKLFSGKKAPTTMFHNKLKGVQNRKFSESEKKEIIKILSEFSVEISSLTID